MIRKYEIASQTGNYAKKTFTPNGKLVTTYKLLVDYGRSIEDGVKAGCYDWVSPNIISKNFKTNCKGVAEVVVGLIHFNRSISANEAINRLDIMGYRPADIHELLAVGEKYPEIQRKVPIIALGSVWKNKYGVQLIPYLYRSVLLRILDTHWLERDLREICRFAAVKK